MNKIKKLLVHQTLIFRNVEIASITKNKSGKVSDESITHVRKIAKAILDILRDQQPINDDTDITEVIKYCEETAKNVSDTVVLNDELVQMLLLYQWQYSIVKNVAIHFLKSK